MTSFFITGTDTDVGKTLTAAVLVSLLQAFYWKPIQSGLADNLSDLQRVKSLTNLPEKHFFPSRYQFQASLSPDQAAEKEGITIDIKQCELPHQSPLIVEGAGGVLVPLNQSHRMLDLMKQFQLPIIIVARGTLGTINHTLLTIEKLNQHRLPIHGVIFSGKATSENKHAIEYWGNVKILFQIPHFDEVSPHQLQSWIKQNNRSLTEALL